MKPRLALNMIIGPGDAQMLNRLMSSFDMKKLFDEIVLVRTTNDPEVIQVINQFADKTSYYEWCTPAFPKGNFGGARDAARLMTSSEYIIWLDADDMLSSEDDLLKVFVKLRTFFEMHPDIDYFVCPYILTLSEEGVPVNVLSRERIFKRQTTICWEKPVHEQLTIDTEVHKRVDLKGLDVVHCPLKDGKVSAARNLEILELEYWKHARDDRHNAFYYARDLIQSDRWEPAIPVLVDYIDTFDGDLRCLYEAAQMLAKYFLYKQAPGAPTLCETTSPLAEKYARLCLSITEENAEPLAILGDTYISKRRNKDAIKMFKLAIAKKFGTGSLQDRVYYEEIPARRLSDLFICENELEQAIWYNKVARKHAPNDKQLIEQRKVIITKLGETICQ